MSIINKLASSLGERGAESNIKLAKDIAATNDKNAIYELVENLNNKDKKIQSDCIKTLYEVSYIKPELIADYYKEFISLLNSKNNRMVWGCMIAIWQITSLKHKEIFSNINLILDTIKKGSVITIDCGVGILSELNKHKQYSQITDPVLEDILWICPIKQLGQYVEKVQDSVSKQNKKIYRILVEKRISECEKETQVKRLNKFLKKIDTI